MELSRTSGFEVVGEEDVGLRLLDKLLVSDPKLKSRAVSGFRSPDRRSFTQ